ncbi:unnamed protein product [Periconia digitata]|uniref:Uncharacterized protein n=1 Tax=Periconia digitata TaxID=1303443 RepID=A0A9W4UHI2_9PLEO|nr:unnamed protein product [Periconia digitata]
MGQYWKVGSIDRRSHLENHFGVKLGDILMNGILAGLVPLLSVPEFSPKVDAKAQTDFAAAFSRNADSPLIRLPQELINMIISECATEASDLVALALTCGVLFRMSAPFLRDVFTQSAAWAGDRLICLGDYANGSPASVDKQEIDDWLDSLKSRHGVTSDDLEFETHNPIYNMIGENTTSLRAPMPPFKTGKESQAEWKKIEKDFEMTGQRPPERWAQDRKSWSSHYQIMKRRHERGEGQSKLDILEEDARQLGYTRELNFLPETFRFPIVSRVGAEAFGRTIRMMAPLHPSALFLRNLSRKQFVHWRKREGESMNRLGQAICSQICWTSDPSGCYWGMKSQWAGDRLDIRGSAAWVPEAEGWTDVTKTVEQLLVDMDED